MTVLKANKSILKSKTFWFNAISLLGNYALQNNAIEIDENSLVLFITIGNMFLRTKTNIGIKLK